MAEAKMHTQENSAELMKKFIKISQEGENQSNFSCSWNRSGNAFMVNLLSCCKADRPKPMMLGKKPASDHHKWKEQR